MRISRGVLHDRHEQVHGLQLPVLPDEGDQVEPLGRVGLHQQAVAQGQARRGPGVEGLAHAPAEAGDAPDRVLPHDVPRAQEELAALQPRDRAHRLQGRGQHVTAARSREFHLVERRQDAAGLRGDLRPLAEAVPHGPHPEPLFHHAPLEQRHERRAPLLVAATKQPPQRHLPDDRLVVQHGGARPDHDVRTLGLAPLRRAILVVLQDPLERLGAFRGVERRCREDVRVVHQPSEREGLCRVVPRHPLLVGEEVDQALPSVPVAVPSRRSQEVGAVPEEQLRGGVHEVVELHGDLGVLDACHQRRRGVDHRGLDVVSDPLGSGHPSRDAPGEADAIARRHPGEHPVHVHLEPEAAERRLQRLVKVRPRMVVKHQGRVPAQVLPRAPERLDPDGHAPVGFREGADRQDVPRHTATPLVLRGRLEEPHQRLGRGIAHAGELRLGPPLGLQERTGVELRAQHLRQVGGVGLEGSAEGAVAEEGRDPGVRLVGVHLAPTRRLRRAGGAPPGEERDDAEEQGRRQGTGPAGATPASPGRLRAPRTHRPVPRGRTRRRPRRWCHAPAPGRPGSSRTPRGRRCGWRPPR